MTHDLPEATAPVIRARGLVKRFGPQVALDGVDLEMWSGRVHAVVGLNGSGKCTLIRTLLAMIHPDDGEVTVATETGPVSVRRVPLRWWGTVGHMVDVPFGYRELTVEETVVVAARLRGLSPGAARVAGDAIIERLELGQWSGRRTHTLSLGNRQRLGLACALVHQPTVLVLDEPTNALDPAGVLVLRRLVAQTARQGTAVLVSSHHLDEMARIAHEITVMHRGRIIGSLPPQGTDLERAFFTMVYAGEGPDLHEEP